MKYDLTKPVDLRAIATDKRALDELLTAAESNDCSALFLASQIFLDAYGRKEGCDPKLANDCLEHGTALGDPLCTAYFGWHRLRENYYLPDKALAKKHINESIEWVKARAEEGHPYAMTVMGHFYANSDAGTEIVVEDLEKSEASLRKACDAGQIGAYFHLGLLIVNGKCRHVKEGSMEAHIYITTARDALLKAANAGHARAQTNLGCHYYYNLGDRKQAQPWFLKSSAQGHTEALGALGELHDPSILLPGDDHSCANEDFSYGRYLQGADKGNIQATVGLILQLRKVGTHYCNRAMAYKHVMNLLNRDGNTMFDWPVSKEKRKDLLKHRKELEAEARHVRDGSDVLLVFKGEEDVATKAPDSRPRHRSERSLRRMRGRDTSEPR